MRVIIYLRVSTEAQHLEGWGLDAQLDACTAWAQARDDLDNDCDIYREVVSGGARLEDRPELLHAVAGLGHGDVLLVARRDRLARDPIVSALVERMAARVGARVVSVAGEGTEDDSPASVLMRRVVDAFAEYERLLVGARTRAALQAKRARGERVGPVPYGYSLAADGVHLREELVEQGTMTRAKALRAEGKSLRAVARSLELEGLRPRRGGSWHPAQVQRLVL